MVPFPETVEYIVVLHVLMGIYGQAPSAAYVNWAQDQHAPSLTVLRQRAGGYTAALGIIWNWIRFDPSDDER